MDVLARHRRADGNGPRAAAFCTGIVALAILALAGCGDGDGDSSETSATAPQPGQVNTATSPSPGGQAPGTGRTSDAAGIRAAIKGVLVSGDPTRACEQDVTATFVATTYGDQKACEQAQLPGSAAKSVKVSAISVNGDSATAVAVPSGGPSDGDKLEVSLLRDGGTWRVDALKSNVPVGP